MNKGMRFPVVVSLVLTIFIMIPVGWAKSIGPGDLNQVDMTQDGLGLLFQDDFNDGNADGWIPSDEQNWYVENGEYIVDVSSGPEKSTSLAGDVNWTDYVFEVDVMGEASFDKIILFRYLDENTSYAINIRSEPVNDIHFCILQDCSSTPFPNSNNIWYHVKIILTGARIQVFVDEALLIDFVHNDENAISHGKIGFMGLNTSKVHFDNVVVREIIVDFTANTEIARHGEPVDFTLILKNPGITDAVDAQITDALPSGFDFREGSLSASSGTASYDAGVITWTGDVIVGGEVTIQFGITVNSSIPPGITVKNTAEILIGGETFDSTISVFIDFYRAYLPCLNNACKPYILDNFSDPGSGWPIYDASGYYSNYVNGEYRIHLQNDYSWFAVTPGVSFAQYDAYKISVDVRSPTIAHIYGTYGIVFGITSGFSQFYEFDIGPDGFYSIYQFNQGYWYKLTDGYSSAIHPGTATNHLEIDYHSPFIDAYINGVYLTQVNASGLSVAGRAGLMTFSYEDGGVDSYFDNFNIFPYVCGPGSVRQARIELSDPGVWPGEGHKQR